MATRKAAAVCCRRDASGALEFLLVRNRADGQWVFPKGTVELWEGFGHMAAVREAWEEAGVRGTAHPVKLGTYHYETRRKLTLEITVQSIEAYLVVVEDTSGIPEPGRHPTWFSAAAAAAALGENQNRQDHWQEACVLLDQAQTRFA